MKVIHIISYLVCQCSILFVSAQSKNTGNIFKNEDKKFFGSLKVGMVASQVDGDDFAGFNKVGLTVGPSVFLQFNEKWVLNVDMMYTQKGSRVGASAGSDLGTYIERYKLNINSLDVPFVLNYVHNSTYLFGAGLSYSAFISSKESLEQLYSTQTYSSDIYKFNRHSVEAVFQVAAMANKNLMLGLRYQYGLSPIRDYRYIPFGRGNQFNNYFSFSASYVF